MQNLTLDLYHESLNKAIIYIENNLDNKILLKDVAREAHLSEFHFHRIFKTLTGETIKDLLMRLKLEKGANQLQYSQKEIQQIAFECGYENHETFTRAFKSYFQLTPKEYRTSIQKKDYRKTTILQR